MTASYTETAESTQDLSVVYSGSKDGNIAIWTVP